MCCCVHPQLCGPAMSRPHPAAEHFMAHGDCLMQAVRTVFNIAIGSESPNIQNTARSALLQARDACMYARFCYA